MFEYHGWVTLRETAGLDDDDTALDEAVQSVRRLVEELDSPYLADLRWMNGVPFLHLAGFANRRGPAGDEVIGLLTDVGRAAPGSYGLLYVHDDEDPEHRNGFRVFRLVRGKVSEHADPFLSPYVPTVEDPDDG